MPSSLTRVISITLVFSTCPPVSVLVRARASSLEAFLGGMASGTRRLMSQLASHLGLMRSRICQGPPLHAYPRATIAWAPLPFLVAPLVIADVAWYWNINPLAIDYAFRPRLRSRLTLGRRTSPRKPWTIGGGDSHSSFVTHAGILTSLASTAGLRRRFTGQRTLSYRSTNAEANVEPTASVTSLSPVTLSAPEHLTSELLRTLSRMAASKPTSWLSRHSDIVSHLANT